MQTTDRDIIQARDEIADNIANNQPLDQITYQLISAVGSTDRNAGNYNRAASYLVALNKIGTREQASSHIANTFLGQRNQCAQCHDSFDQAALAGNTDGAIDTQKEFFEFHTFFAQLKFEQADGAEGENFYVDNRNYLPLGREGRVEASYKYTDLTKQIHEVFPRYGDYEAGSNGFVAKVDRRSQLANLIAGSPEFGEAMVDHVWASMLNIPVSGIDGTTDPVLGELRTELATQFAANDFDLLWLVTTIASSEAFAVGVGTEEQLAANNPFLGAAPRFNVFYHRLENRRSAVGSLAIVAQAYRSGDVEAALSAGLLARVNPTVESKPRTILPFVPGKASLWATSPAVSKQLDMIADSKMSAEDKIRHVVLAALGRTARNDEIEQAAIIMENGLDARTALQDVWWSLLNSVEYSLPLDIR